MSGKNQLDAWLQLVRLPNLFTIPGEAIVAGLLVGIAWNQILMASGAFLLIYVGGLIVNDIADVKEDLQERDWRPIPSGRISTTQARVVALGVYGNALFLAFLISGFNRFFAVVCLVVLLTLFYNFKARRFPWIGWLTIAACRALITISIILLTPDSTEILPWIYAGGIFGYIFIISAAAHNETEGAPGFPVHLLVPLVVGSCLFALFYYSIIDKIYFLFALPVIVVLFLLTRRISFAEEPAVVQQFVGKSIGAVLLFQGAALLVTGRLEGLLLWFVYPISSMAARKYKGS